ncbi:hypothetical protein Tco_0766424 [Tanacetum coccineum]
MFGGVCTAKKLSTFSKLATIDPPGDITVQISPPKRSLMPDSFGLQYTKMPTSWLKITTRANDKEKFHKGMRCLKIPSKFGAPRAIINDRGTPTDFCNGAVCKGHDSNTEDFLKGLWAYVVHIGRTKLDDALLAYDTAFTRRKRNKIYDPGICIEVKATRFRSTLYPVIDTLLPFSSENEDKVFNHGALASKEKSPSSPSHRGFKASKLFHQKSPMLIHRDNTPNLGDCPDSEASCARGFCPSITRASSPQLHLGIRYPNLIG